ncbi:molybdenum cofactor biosynthesis protein [Candidatus Desantisbacteria bacterium CG2_30_40_21]|uniref:Molybdopterin adenylyltransferase n=4 Tax=unclassified Candidatus Desantisiibacteriota TaxID=3106372 RepID=A0A2M7P2Y7_9BACT|nr:MAG: molybdenum cofactor biosynthesis protein [Candidatus Desantisbacteria bacterium CG2_30_40_21]PIP41806.1 MAG: molybdopterin adenylyltransferase [Candidatus Desantisbacteria bacterium CG23_combo_of_CG06-09_8_20_14_all_40_23]PIY19970.1 MAG: molybdopterin adenylyltransferase [Candidatus Desantisbacteria bacterium CG_4_10_14_3_um_filter_40_18]PJB29848.1 MAG: molybdopterin adenylyltransferase [Candidatus Desantisbacteria bacterium CG_4_9_14_3_um_filter_40_11]
MFRIGILTISDRCSKGERDDKSGEAIRGMVARLNGEVVQYEIVPDVREIIAQKLIEMADVTGCELVLTTGGTGFSPRDVTPEATSMVIDRAAPGLAEAMRLSSLSITPHAMLSRAIAGIRKQCLIVNLPGSPKAVTECLDAIIPALPHGLKVLRGVVGDCG